MANATARRQARQQAQESTPTRPQRTGTKEVERREPGTVDKATGEVKQPTAPKLPVVEADFSETRTLVCIWPKIVRPSDGKIFKCAHSTWGHSSEKSAAQCARALAREAGVALK